MRCSILPILPLLVATCLIIADISFGLPSNHDEYKNPIIAQSASARSLDTSRSRAVSSMVAPDGDNRHLRRGRDIPNSSNQPSTALIQRHNYLMDTLRLHSRDSSLAKRSLVGDLFVTGFQLLWDYADVIVPSIPAFDRTSEFYKNITQLDFGLTVTNFVITYGYFRLMVAYWGPLVTQAITPQGLEHFMKEFAQLMLRLTAGVILGSYRILVFGANVAFWLTMAIVENAQLPNLVSGPGIAIGG